MANETHQYETAVVWTEDRRGTLAAASCPSIMTGAPPEFGGTDNLWSPELLCVAAVNSCLMLTFVAVAANSRVPFRQYSASATGTLEKVEGRGQVITKVVVKPRVTIGPDVDRAKVERLLQIAEKHCFISNSLRSEVTLEPEIVTA
ncbi:MAG: OsmC family protein [Candidatus Binatia bacterium]